MRQKSLAKSLRLTDNENKRCCRSAHSSRSVWSVCEPTQRYGGHQSVERANIEQSLSFGVSFVGGSSVFLYVSLHYYVSHNSIVDVVVLVVVNIALNNVYQLRINLSWVVLSVNSILIFLQIISQLPTSNGLSLTQ